MSGVPEQPAVHGRGTHGAVVSAPAPAGAVPGPDDGARAGDDSAPVPIPPGPELPVPASPGTGVPPPPGASPLLAPRPSGEAPDA